MKKVLVTCMAVLALFALANTASAITCTTDTRPAATLLVPWFQVTFNSDGTASGTGAAALDTFVTIGNASSAPTIAHVSVYNDRSVLVLDFNVALTGFDIQAMQMSRILSGNLPITPVNTSHAAVSADVCQRNTAAAVYPNPNGYLRVRPLNPATSSDNTIATALYPNPAFAVGSAFQLQTLDSLDETSDSLGCSTPNGVFSGLIHGYITIDHANYCNLSDPTDPNYYAFDAIGMENNLWGEILYTSGTGLTTYAMNTVSIEADRAFSLPTGVGTVTGGGQFTQTAAVRTRTFYARYWSPTTETECGNCTGTLASGNNLSLNAPWDTGFGDEREPLGLKYAARWFETGAGGISTRWTVWRASAGSLTNLTGGGCTAVEPVPSIVFYDEDENPVTISITPLPSPLPPPSAAVNIPLETQRRSPGTSTGPLTALPGSAGFGFPFPSGAVAGWASVEFRNLTQGTNLDQAWMGYDFSGSAAFLTAGAAGTQLDPSSCNPLGVPVAPAAGGVNLITPTIPGGITGNTACAVNVSCTGTGPTQ